MSYIPGILLVCIISLGAFIIIKVPMLSSLSPVVCGIFIGILFANTMGVPKAAAPGIGLAGKRLLRIAVALLGLQVTIGQLVDIGLPGLGAAAAVLTVTYISTVWFGRMLGVDRGLSQLLAAGTAVCGASAIAATSTVTRSGDEDVTYAIASITLFGTIAMFLYPLIAQSIDLNTNITGLWMGLSIHEVAQVVGAGFQGGPSAAQSAVVVKLARVVMLAPLILCVAFAEARIMRQLSADPQPDVSPGPPTVPFFVVAFLVLVAANSAALVPESLRLGLVAATPVLLTASLTALGLGTRFSKLRERGARPLLLAALSSALIAGLGLAVVCSL